MIQPSAVQILRTIESTLVQVVEPDVQGTAARSALATIGHLLRHVALRIENEGQILSDDIAALKLLLNELHSYLTKAGDSAEAAAVADALGKADPPSGRYPSLDLLATHALGLRQGLHDIIIHLQQQRGARAGDPGYEAARAAIRDYLAAEVRAEGMLIHPAFADKGPRR